MNKFRRLCSHIKAITQRISSTNSDVMLAIGL